MIARQSLQLDVRGFISDVILDSLSLCADPSTPTMGRIARHFSV